MDDSDFIVSSVLPRKVPSTSSHCAAKPTTASDCKIDSDLLLPGADKNKCYVCKKDLRHLNATRKALHINSCLDKEEAKNKYASDKEKWSNTLDCPICGEPLQPGPYRAAHAKRCGTKHNVPPARLLVLMETQSKVAQMKKRNGIAHTKLRVPKLEVKKPDRVKEEPRSAFKEQMDLALAISASLESSNDSFTNVSKAAPVVKPFKKDRHRRSYSFYELEPRSCQCSTFQQIQENFISKFKVKRYNNFRDMMRRRMERTSVLLGDINKCIRKLERLEHLADDVERYSNSTCDISVYSKENERISAHRFIISARAPALAVLIDGSGSLSMREFSSSSIRCYMRFLSSASVEWTENEKLEILELAKRFGPPELQQLCGFIVNEKSVSQLREEQLSSNADSDKKSLAQTSSESSNSCNKPYCGGFQPCLQEHSLQVEHKILPELNAAEEICNSKKIVGERFEENDSTKVQNNLASKADGSQDTIIFLDDSLSSNVSEATSVNIEKKPASEAHIGTELDTDLEISDIEEPFDLKQQSSAVERKDFRMSEPKSVEASPDVFEVVSGDDDEGLLDQKIKGTKDSLLQASHNLSQCDNFSAIVQKHENAMSTKRDAVYLPEKYAGTALDDELADAYCRSTPTKCVSIKRGPQLLLDEENIVLSPITKDQEPTGRDNDIVYDRFFDPENPEVLSFLRKTGVSSSSSTLSNHITEEKKLDKCASPKRKRRKAQIGVQYSSTPAAQTGIVAKRLKELGSNVKVLKTSDITPMPLFEQMTDKELKEELAKFGIRPLGKKKGIALLRKIYEETHPIVIDESPVSSKSGTNSLRRNSVDGNLRSSKTLFYEEPVDAVEEALADSTLNVSLEEDKIQEESAFDMLDDNGPLPKDLDGMQSALLAWLRRNENEELYSDLLTLNPVSFDEFADRVSRSNSTAAAIPKKALIEIMDRLHITFRLPADGWKRKHQKLKLKKQKK